MNMFGMAGFDWIRAPLKWQVLDVVYLVLDVIVAVGLVFGWCAGSVAFFIAAISQIVLYTLLRTWIIDFPEEFARTPQEVRYLDSLIVFHLPTLALMILAIWPARPASTSA